MSGFRNFEGTFMALSKNNSKAPSRIASTGGIILLAVWTIAGLRAQDEEMGQVLWGSADSSRVDAVSEVVHLHGSAWVEMPEEQVRLEAAYIRYDRFSQQACAYGVPDSAGTLQGKPVLKQSDQTFTQDSLCFDLQTQRGLSRHAVTVQGEAVFHAGVAKRQADERIHVADAKFTTCDAPNPHYHFHIRRAVMIPGEKVVSGPFYLKFRKIPAPLALPFGWFPTKKPEKQSHGLLMPGYGDGGALGFFLKDLGYYLPIGEHLDTRLLGDIYTGGSWALRSTTNYRYRYRASGAFNLSFQQRREGFADTPTLSVSNTFFIRWNHTQDPKARPNTRFSANVNVGSSNNFANTLNSSREDFLTNTFTSSLQWSANLPGKPLNFAASARHAQNSNTNRVDLTLPSLTMNLSRTSLRKLLALDGRKGQWLDEIALSGSTRFEQTLSAADSAIAARDWAAVELRNGLKHNLTATTQLRAGFVSITPNFTFNEFWAFESLNSALEETEPGQVTAVTDTLRGFTATRDWRLAATASTRFYGMFNLGADRRIPAIRHVLSPSVGLSYTPERNRTQVDTLGGESLTWNPYSLSRFTPGDVRAAGSVNLALSQNLEAKVRDRQTGDIRKVKIVDNFATSANCNLIADSLQWSSISTRAFTTLFNKIRINAGATHNLYDRDSTGQRVNVFLADVGKGWARLERANLAMGTSFSRQQVDFPFNLSLDYNVTVARVWNPTAQADEPNVVQTISARGGVKLFDKWTIDAAMGYDLESFELTRTDVHLYWDLHCWEFAFDWIPTGFQKSWSFRLNIKASMLRDLKIEARRNAGQALF